MNNADISKEDQLMKSEMEKMAPSYDSYMRKVTFGRERTLRETCVPTSPVRMDTRDRAEHLMTHCIKGKGLREFDPSAQSPAAYTPSTACR